MVAPLKTITLCALSNKFLTFSSSSLEVAPQIQTIIICLNQIDTLPAAFLAEH